MATKQELKFLKRDQSAILMKYACEELIKRGISHQLSTLLEETFSLADVSDSKVQEVWLKVSSN